jgi:MFS family permease
LRTGVCLMVPYRMVRTGGYVVLLALLYRFPVPPPSQWQRRVPQQFPQDLQELGRKPIAFVGYLVTTLATASFGLATAAWHVLIARAAAWLGRGVRTPVRKALLAAAVDRSVYGRAFGFESAHGSLVACGITGKLPRSLCVHTIAGHDGGSLDRYSRSGERAGSRSARSFRRTTTPVAEGLPTCF